MVVIDIDNDKKFYMDNKLNKELEHLQKEVNTKDKDRVIIVDGSEGSGKSVFAMQLCKKLDNTFDISRICFTPEEFKKAIMEAGKGQAVLFDEAFTGLSSRSSLSAVNRLLVTLMMEMRQKNLFVVIAMPTFFLLDKYVALWRAKDLFHIYTKEGKRGFWVYFGEEKKKLLYLFGKETYSYSGKNIPRSGFFGRFYEQYVVDEERYRDRKKEALGEKEVVKVDKKSDKFLRQRNVAFKIFRNDFKQTAVKIVDYYSKYGEVIGEDDVRFYWN